MKRFRMKKSKFKARLQLSILTAFHSSLRGTLQQPDIDILDKYVYVYVYIHIRTPRIADSAMTFGSQFLKARAEITDTSKRCLVDIMCI